MNRPRARSAGTTALAAPLLGGVLALAIAGPLGAGDTPKSAGGKIIPLPDEDRQLIEQYLGEGVVGRPIGALPIDKPTQWIGLENTQREWVKRVHGDNVGSTSELVITALDRPGRIAWKLQRSTGTDFGQQDGQGNLVEHSSQDLTQSVISRYTPPEPILRKGMEPGSSVQLTINVGVYDLSNPSQESHSGQLNLTYSYVGAYEITVPAGTYDAVLMKWDYDGKVGPASVKDTQYWFFVKGIGPAATIDKQDISAFLVYNVNTKNADVLVRRDDE